MDHAKSFDSLLSLMPADVYFGKDNSVCLAHRRPTLQLHFLVNITEGGPLLRTNGRGRNKQRRRRRLRRGLN